MAQVLRSGGRQSGQIIPFANISAATIEGLMPAVDPRVVAKQYVLNGRNFLWDAKGPYSGFGAVYISRQTIANPGLAQTFRVDDDIWLFTGDSILEYDVVTDLYWPRFVYPADTTEWPWSYAFVGNKHYFCRRGVGIIEYSPATGNFQVLVDAFLPTDPVGICECRGRLIVVGTDFVSNSAQDDASDFEPSLLTGASSQVLSIIGGEPFGVFRIDDGFVVFTSTGLLLADFNAYTNILFIFHILSRKHPAIGPFGIIQTDDGEITYLSRQGLMQTVGKAPTPFEPLFSQYLTRELLPTRNLADISTFRLYYAVDQQLLLLSVQSANLQRVYDYAFCLYRPVGKWGIFNARHYSFGEFVIQASVASGFNFGYINSDGHPLQFSNDLFVEITVLPDTGYAFETVFDMPARLEMGVWHFPVIMVITDVNDTALEGRAAGWYDFVVIDEFLELQDDVVPEVVFGSHMVMDAGLRRWSYALIDATKAGLDANIMVGMFRYDMGQFTDQMGICTNLSVGMNAFAAAPEVDSEDYMFTAEGGDTFEDWLIIDDLQDWGAGAQVIGSWYNIQVIGTNDATNVFTSAVPVALEEIERTIFYTCMVTGLFHTLYISADEPFQVFHLKSAELSGTAGGRL